MRGFGVVVEVLEGNRLAIIGFDACFTDWRAFDVFAEVCDIGLEVIRLVIEMNDPSFLIELVQP